MKGAVEHVLKACQAVQTADGLASMTDTWESTIHENVETLAAQGLRVLALANREVPSSAATWERQELEREMTLVGLVGLYGELSSHSRASLPRLINDLDPPRPETKGAVRRCHKAGIQVVSNCTVNR